MLNLKIKALTERLKKTKAALDTEEGKVAWLLKNIPREVRIDLQERMEWETLKTDWLGRTQRMVLESRVVWQRHEIANKQRDSELMQQKINYLGRALQKYPEKSEEIGQILIWLTEYGVNSKGTYLPNLKSKFPLEPHLLRIEPKSPLYSPREEHILRDTNGRPIAVRPIVVEEEA